MAVNSDYFNLKLEVEKKAWPVILDWLAQRYGLTVDVDVRDDPEFQDQDIDVILSDFGQKYTAEVKVRTRLYGDLALETLSCRERGTPGFLYKSKAALLVYVFYVGGRLHPNSDVFAFSSLRAWFERNRRRYWPKYAPNPPGDPLYHSEIVPVPFRDLPKYLYYPRTP